jgi:hypothetical protein
MNDDQNLNHEEKAVDALITGALHAWPREEGSEAEINEFLSVKVELSDAEKASLSRIRQQFREGHTANKTSDEPFTKPELESSYMAMNRENSKDQLPATVREEIEKKRARLLAQLRSKKRSAE